jgi:DNA modification methylase
VLDPFAGSGTVIVAALENDCNVIGIEIESKFCEVIKERLKDYRQKTDKSNNLASKEDIFSK